MSKVKPKVVFIFSVGHSGTTLLDMILGSSPECFSVGELKQWNNYFSKISSANPRTNYQDFSRCTCGEKIKECPFWSQINDKSSFNLRSFGKKKTRHDYLKFAFGLKKDLNKIYLPPNDYFKILKKIAELNSGKWIIDSSKTIEPLLRLLKLYKKDKIELRILWIVRHCSSIMYSHFRKGKNPYEFSRRWLKLNLVKSKVLRRSGAPYLKINYYNLANFPQETIKRIEEFLGPDLSNWSKNIKNTSFHNIGGNPMRFKNLDNIKYDDEWKRNLPKSQKIIGSIFNKLGTPLGD